MSEQRLKQIFAEVLGIETTEVSDGLEYNSIPQWNSVAHMALIAALDDEFDIMMDTEDVLDMSSFGKAREILTKYGVTF